MDQNKYAEHLAKVFHDTYEDLAPSCGYQTRKESAVPWDDVPRSNKVLMIAVCRELLNKGLIRMPKR